METFMLESICVECGGTEKWEEQTPPDGILPDHSFHMCDHCALDYTEEEADNILEIKIQIFMNKLMENENEFGGLSVQELPQSL